MLDITLGTNTQKLRKKEKLNKSPNRKLQQNDMLSKTLQSVMCVNRWKSRNRQLACREKYYTLSLSLPKRTLQW